MKTKAMITVLVSVAMILTAPLVATGKERPADPGGGGGGGGGNAGDAAGALYGDLYVIERDGAGVPITRPVTYPDPETGADVTVNCPQPLAETCGLLPFWGECGSLSLPPGVLSLPTCTFDPELYDPCAVYYTDVDPAYGDMLQTVSFGRGSVSRSPATVIDSSYAEAIRAINLAVPQCDALQAIKQDPAGRIMLCLATETDLVTYAWKTIDSPLENLGLYREVMTDGCFLPIDEVQVGEEGQTITVTTYLSDTAELNLSNAGLGHLACAIDNVSEDPTKADMLSAAVFIGAAADKFYPVDLDQIINLNTYLGVNPYTYVREKKNSILTVTYFPFTVDGTADGEWFRYDFGVDACKPGTAARLLQFVTPGDPTSTLLTIVPELDVFGSTPPGVDLRNSNGVALTVCRAGFPLSVVCDDPGSVGCGGANWFAQAAEDARKTIWYLHNYEPPEFAW